MQLASCTLHALHEREQARAPRQTLICEDCGVDVIGQPPAVRRRQQSRRRQPSRRRRKHQQRENVLRIKRQLVTAIAIALAVGVGVGVTDPLNAACQRAAAQ